MDKRSLRLTKEKPVVKAKGQIKRFGPDEAATAGDYMPGDFILTHGTACTSRIIIWGQKLWYRRNDRKYTKWSHAALIVSPEGDIIEALGHGVERNHLSKYTPREYTIVRIDPDLASPADRDQVVAYAEWASKMKYGYLTIISIALNLLFGGKFSFFIDGQTICSGLVARALERTNVIFDRSPSHIMPADLAAYFEVEPVTADTKNVTKPGRVEAAARPDDH